MDLGFDIFRTLDDGTPLWIKQVATLDDGKKSLEALMSAAPGEYFIRDASTGEIVLRMGCNSTRLTRTSTRGASGASRSLAHPAHTGFAVFFGRPLT